MAIDRRAALGLLAGGLAAPLLPRSLRAARAGPLWLSARARGDGGHSVSGFRRSGAPVFDLALPGRGHSFAVSPDGRAAVHFARRPGEFALAIDLARGTVLDRFAPPDNRRFQGHGAFGPDGRLLYASENDFAAARGAIGIYDAAEGYARLGELPSHGIGPHEIVLLPDGNTLAVANGGIATHPDMPRVKLNLPDMAPSLAYVDRRDGALLGKYRLDAALNRLGIRHLAVGRNGAVAVAMQYQGPRGDLVPLVALHRNGDLQFLNAPEATLRAMRQYCGSVAFDAGGRIAAAFGAAREYRGLLGYGDRRLPLHRSPRRRQRHRPRRPARRVRRHQRAGRRVPHRRPLRRGGADRGRVRGGRTLGQPPDRGGTRGAEAGHKASLFSSEPPLFFPSSWSAEADHPRVFVCGTGTGRKKEMGQNVDGRPPPTMTG